MLSTSIQRRSLSPILHSTIGSAESRLLVTNRHRLFPTRMIKVSTWPFSFSISISLISFAEDGMGLLPTPSPEMMHAAAYGAVAQSRVQAIDPYDANHPSWETLRSDGSSMPSTGAGMKRSHDYAVDDFFTDLKRRRLVPSYDSRKSHHLFVILYVE